MTKQEKELLKKTRLIQKQIASYTKEIKSIEIIQKNISKCRSTVSAVLSQIGNYLHDDFYNDLLMEKRKMESRRKELIDSISPK